MNALYLAAASHPVLPADQHQPEAPRRRPDLACLRVTQSLLSPLQAMLAKCCGPASPEATTTDRRELLAHAHQQALLSDDDLGRLLVLLDHVESGRALNSAFMAVAKAVADRIAATGQELGVREVAEGIKADDLGAGRPSAPKPTKPAAQRWQAYVEATALAASPEFNQSLLAMLGTAKRLHTWGMAAASMRLLVLVLDTTLRLQFRLTFQGRDPAPFAVPALLGKLRSAAVTSRQEHDLLLAAWKSRSKPEDATAWEAMHRACRVAAASFAGVADEQPLAGRVAP